MMFLSSHVSDRLPKVIHWSRILGQFASIQLLVQAVGLVSGILLVRTLSKTDYAYFTLANTMQATMSLMADVGISSGLSAIGGRVWHDRYRFGQLINTALHLRRSLLVFSMLVISPILLWMLLSNGASLGYASIITAAVLIGLSFQVTSGVLVVIPRLHLHVGRLQKLDLLAASVRLGLLFVAYSLLLNTVTAVLAAVMTFVIQYFVLKRWARQTVDTSAPVNHEDRTELWAIVRKQAPNDIYFCFQGQIMIWLISIFGSTKNIADIGALGRLAVIFTLISSTMTSVILPRFARCQSAKILKVRYLQIMGCFILFGSGLVLLAILFPGQLLWILGKQYGNLESEVVLIVISALANSLLGAMFSLNASKAWFPPALVNIGLTTMVQIILIFLLDLSTLHGVILFNIISLIPAVAIFGWVTHNGIKKMEITP